MVDFTDIDAVTEVARRHRVDGVLTVSADRAVPVVAAVAEELGLPGIGRETAHRMTHKLVMRDALARAGVPQPPFGAVRSTADAADALAAAGLPAVLKPVDSGGQRAVFRIESPGDLDANLAEALAESPTGEGIVEAFVDGIELNGIAIARGGEVTSLTLSDRLRPPGIGFGVGWIHVFPPSIPDEQRERAERIAEDAVRALGLRDGIAFPQLIASPDGGESPWSRSPRASPAGRWPTSCATRSASTSSRSRCARRSARRSRTSSRCPQFFQPLAIRFFTAQPGPLPTGRVVGIGSLEPVLAAEGVVQADTYLELGETIRPVRRDGDRRGYVIAVADTPEEALAARRGRRVAPHGRGRGGAA